MLQTEPISAGAGFVARFVAGLLRRVPAKRLEGTVLGRGIVAEIPFNAPCRLIDLEGNELRGGVYVVLVRLWNRGLLPVLVSDFPPSAPLRLEIAKSVKVLGVESVSTVESFRCDPELDSDNGITIIHEGFGSGDDAIVSIFFAAPNPYQEVAVRGRILGQTSPLDRTDREHRASIGERVAGFAVLLTMLLAVPALVFGTSMISMHHGWAVLWIHPEQVPWWVMSPLALGCFVASIFLTTVVGRWLQRRQQPMGFPLECDLEPPFWENMRAVVKMVFFGRRYRFSQSLFNIGEPVLMSGKRVRRRSVKDWIR